MRPRLSSPARSNSDAKGGGQPLTQRRDLLLHLRLRLSAPGGNDQETERRHDARQEDAGDVGRRRGRRERDQRAQSDRGAARRRRGRHRRARLLRNRLGFPLLVVGVDDALGLAAHMVDHPRAVGMKGPDVRRAQRRRRVVADAARDRGGYRLPLAEVLIDQPIDQLRDAPLDLPRRIRNDPLLEFLLDARAVEQIDDASETQRVLEVLVPARLHVDEHFLDRGHAQLEPARQVCRVDRELAVQSDRAPSHRRRAASGVRPRRSHSGGPAPGQRRAGSPA